MQLIQVLANVAIADGNPAATFSVSHVNVVIPRDRINTHYSGASEILFHFDGRFTHEVCDDVVKDLIRHVER